MIPPTDVLDLFAGPGGWSLAATVLGLNELGIEYDPTAVRTRTAAGFRSVLADVSELNPANFAARGFIASPPCQAFSNAGKGHGRDYTDELVDAIHAARLARPPPPRPACVARARSRPVDRPASPRVDRVRTSPGGAPSMGRVRRLASRAGLLRVGWHAQRRRLRGAADPCSSVPPRAPFPARSPAGADARPGPDAGALRDEAPVGDDGRSAGLRTD